MTDPYAVVGSPISHSQSPFIHAWFAKNTAQAMSYVAIEAPPGGFDGAADAFRAAGGRGLNVTTPFKLDAFAYADAVSDRARRAGAVNALRFSDAMAEGENFDGVGLVRDITVNLKQAITGRRVLIAGAGGAARGILAPILAEAPAEVLIVNRTADKARSLARLFSDDGPISGGAYGHVGDAGFDIVINATSAGLIGERPPIPPGAFGAGALAYDMTYGQGLTGFLATARAGGASRIVDGVGMLVEQAAEAFAWWRGVRPPTAAVLSALIVPLT